MSNEDYDDEKTEITVAPPQDRRRHPRYDSQLTAVVYSATAAYRTKTLNLSEGGLLLSSNLPVDFLSVGLEVLIIEEKTDGGPHQYYLFKGRSVGGNRNSCRLEFTWTPPQTQTAFQNLLRSLENQGLQSAA